MLAFIQVMRSSHQELRQNKTSDTFATNRTEEIGFSLRASRNAHPYIYLSSIDEETDETR